MHARVSQTSFRRNPDTPPTTPDARDLPRVANAVIHHFFFDACSRCSFPETKRQKKTIRCCDSLRHNYKASSIVPSTGTRVIAQRESRTCSLYRCPRRSRASTSLLVRPIPRVRGPPSGPFSPAGKLTCGSAERVYAQLDTSRRGKKTVSELFSRSRQILKARTVAGRGEECPL